MLKKRVSPFVILAQSVPNPRKVVGWWGLEEDAEK